MALFRNRKILVFVLALAGFIGFLVAGLQANQFGPQQQPIVRYFPSIPVTLLSGEKKEQATLVMEHDFQLVNVWAPWCGVCKAEHSYLIQLAQQGVPMIGVNYRDHQSSANNYLGQYGNPYQHVLLDPQGKLGIELGVIGTPETYLVTQQGEIVYKHIGMLSPRVWQKHFAHYFQPST